MFSVRGWKGRNESIWGSNKNKFAVNDVVYDSPPLRSALPMSDGTAKREFVNRRTKSFNESSLRVHFLHWFRIKRFGGGRDIKPLLWCSLKRMTCFCDISSIGSLHNIRDFSIAIKVSSSNQRETFPLSMHNNLSALLILKSGCIRFVHQQKNFLHQNNAERYFPSSSTTEQRSRCDDDKQEFSFLQCMKETWKLFSRHQNVHKYSQAPSGAKL